MLPVMTCKESYCNNNANAYRGWCWSCYNRQRRYGDPSTVKPFGPAPTHVGCSVAGCARPHAGKGWCRTHLSRWRRHGDPLIVSVEHTSPLGISEWVSALLTSDGPDTCVTWPFHRNKAGIARWGKGQNACPLILSMIVRPTPDKPLALHECGKGHEGCVNPKHLYWGDHKDNYEDAMNHGTHVNTRYIHGT